MQIIKQTEISNGKTDFSLSIKDNYCEDSTFQYLNFSFYEKSFIIDSEFINEKYNESEHGNLRFELSVDEMKTLHTNLGLLIQDIQAMQSL